jgi:hypothetical protein
MLRALPSTETPPLEGGVYFLWRGPQLLYIGQTYCLNERLHAHWSAKIGLSRSKRIPFAWRSWLVCPDAARVDMETMYIRTYLPPFNEKIQ